ncbi:hypothetical protein PFNF135_04110 [Plasmodium falciparum NF135/5.C10]|uniref:SAP domain-containing protein n=1 Tax=Plasmodium falciparum NF135/5.C10 TaxID=1036726 RepID=W4ICP3_PLAFA|nr:hypothetical protein PFNF135_04110 [Plasmodium falciparum NF135/5.C10]
MSELQVKDELRKRGYPTFGSIDEIKTRLCDVMKIRQNNYIDIRNILKKPEDNVLSHMRLEKLKENIKTYKENEQYGDTESKIKQLDASIEISKFINDPVHYLRIDSTHKFINQNKPKNKNDPNNNTQNDQTNNMEIQYDTENNILKEPIINDYNFNEEISMAEKIKKTFSFENEEKLPDQIITRFNNNNNNNNNMHGGGMHGDGVHGDDMCGNGMDELDEETQEKYREQVLKYGSLQETIEEFNYKHNLSLDFIGDFICKSSNAHIQDINKYRYKTKEEIEKLKENDFYHLFEENNLNNNFIVYKFVNTKELIKNYLTTSNIVTLIEYANIADPVDIIHYYTPENLFMISEDYNITIDRVIDACTRLNIKLPYGGDTHLNKECFNFLTCYLSKYKQIKRKT